MLGLKPRANVKFAEIGYSKFREFTQSSPEILYMLGNQMAKRLRATTRKVGDLAFLDVTGRVARTLLELTKEPDAMTHPDGMQIKNYSSRNRSHCWLFKRNGWTCAKKHLKNKA